MRLHYDGHCERCPTTAAVTTAAAAVPAAVPAAAAVAAAAQQRQQRQRQRSLCPPITYNINFYFCVQVVMRAGLAFKADGYCRRCLVGQRRWRGLEGRMRWGRMGRHRENVRRLKCDGYGAGRRENVIVIPGILD